MPDDYGRIDEDNRGASSATEQPEPVISDYVSARVIPAGFPSDERFFVISDKHGNTQKVAIPKALRDEPVITGLRKYFSSFSHTSKDYDSYYRRKIAEKMSVMLELMNRAGGVKTSFWMHLLSLIKKEYRHIELTGWYLQAIIKATLTAAAAEEVTKAGIITGPERSALIHLRKLAPNIKRPPSKKKESLEQQFDIDISARQMQKSLRTWASSFVLEWAWIRDQFKDYSQEVYDNALTSHLAGDICFTKTHGRPDCPHATPVALDNYNVGERGNDAFRYTATILMFAENLKHPLLTDYVFYMHVHGKKSSGAWKTFFNSEDTLDFNIRKSEQDISDYLAGWIDEKGIPLARRQSAPWNYEFILRKDGGKIRKTKKVYREAIGKIPAPFSVMFPTKEEQIVSAWLLASDDSQRQQRSNIINSTVGDMTEFSYKGVDQIAPRFYKGRSNKFGGAPIPMTKSLTFHTLTVYRESIIDCYEKGVFKTEGRPISECALFPLLFHNESKDRRPLGEYQQRKLYAHFSRTSLSTQYMREKHLDKHGAGTGFQEAMARMAETTSVKCKISITAIAETSQQAFEESRYGEITHSPDMNIPPNLEDGLALEREAEVRNHSAETQNSTYTHRTKNRILLKRQSNFAKMVGDEMVRMAELIAEKKFLSATPLTVSEAYKTLGMVHEQQSENEVEPLYEQAAAMDYLVEATGMLSNGHDIYIIKTALTAALIQAFISHIDNTIETLALSNQQHAINAMAHRMFLKAILDMHFDQVLIRKGEEQYGDVEFPFPDYQEFLI